MYHVNMKELCFRVEGNWIFSAYLINNIKLFLILNTVVRDNIINNMNCIINLKIMHLTPLNYGVSQEI